MNRIFLLLCAVFLCHVNVVFAFQNEDELNPINIHTEIQINKIYGINEQDETYIVDAYLVTSWKANHLGFEPKKTIIYENQLVDQKLEEGLWIPAFEFINVLSSRDIANKQIIIRKDSTITYNERFNAVFSSEMKFETFPFDQQRFVIQLETFSYNEGKVKFSVAEGHQKFTSEGISEEWEILDEEIYTSSIPYTHLSENGEPVIYSRYNQEVLAKRKTRYYVWQFIIPIFLIISISWSVFWLSSLSDQLATNFTLMLTVVAFNFNASSMLPNLPYSTFIESLITIGYISIFISLIIVIKAHLLEKESKKLNFKKLMNYCKLLFPISFLLSVLIQVFLFF